ncbi:MAG: kanamycin nucleotidyltransferase C-terminal domain-containing protein [Chloroflexota bacterium]
MRHPNHDILFSGPQSQSREDRLRIVEQLKQDLLDEYNDQLIAIGLSGSIAQKRDRPYSDIDMFAVVEQLDTDRIEIVCHLDGSKVDGNIYSDASVRKKAVQVDERWSLRGGFLHIHPVYGDTAYFEMLKELRLSVPQAKIEAQIAAIIWGHYEAIGKFRNAKESGQTHDLARACCTFAEYNALMLGLAHHTVYTTGQTMLEESMQLAHRPDGHDDLCRLVMSGTLSNASRILTTVERAWAGIEAWVKELGLDITPYFDKSNA